MAQINTTPTQKEEEKPAPMNMKATATVEHVSELFIKPKHQVPNSNKPVHLTSWDLTLLALHYNQRGLLFTKPQQNNFSINELVETLKDSLSHTLVHFYPLAGQLASRTELDRNRTVIYIDCNKGPGVRFIHASLEMTVSEIVTPTHVPLVVHSLFDQKDWRVVNYDGHTRPLLSIQVTELVDGVFIGCSMNHVVADGTSFWHFWNVWSEIQRASANGMAVQITRPVPVHARWFPSECTQPLTLPFIDPDHFISMHRYEPPSELVDRIFYLSSESIAKLKAKANKEIKTNKISSYQSLTALLWRTIVRAKGLKPEELTHCRLAANNRSRLDPPLPSEYFGNSVQPIITSITTSELLERSLGSVAWLLHQSVVNHTNQEVRDSVKKWVEAPFVVGIGKVVGSNSIKTASSPRFDVYGNEFVGLGKPVAVRSGYANRFDGKVYTHPGREGGGSVELEVCLMFDSMSNLVSDPEFMAVASST